MNELASDLSLKIIITLTKAGKKIQNIIFRKNEKWLKFQVNFFNLLSIYFCCRKVCKALDQAILNVDPFGEKFLNEAVKTSEN